MDAHMANIVYLLLDPYKLQTTLHRIYKLQKHALVFSVAEGMKIQVLAMLTICPKN